MSSQYGKKRKIVTGDTWCIVFVKRCMAFQLGEGLKV